MGSGCSLLQSQVHQFSERWQAVLWTDLSLCALKESLKMDSELWTCLFKIYWVFPRWPLRHTRVRFYAFIVRQPLLEVAWYITVMIIHLLFLMQFKFMNFHIFTFITFHSINETRHITHHIDHKDCYSKNVIYMVHSNRCHKQPNDNLKPTILMNIAADQTNSNKKF